MSGDFSSYWMESSLKISPVEQVELLTKLYNNDFGFAPENIKAVKDSIHIASSDTSNFYAKTGTGRVNGQDVNGWFIGFIERTDNTYFFATNIHAKDHADGSTTDGQSTDGGDTAEEQEAGATADTGTAADASTDTQDDSTEN